MMRGGGGAAEKGEAALGCQPVLLCVPASDGIEAGVHVWIGVAVVVRSGSTFARREVM